MAKFIYLEWLVRFLLNNSDLNFDWDDGNQKKSEAKHGIDFLQIESVFKDPLVFSLGIQISPEVSEPRFGIIGKDFLGNILFVCFTFRGKKIRAISSRLANKKERQQYDKV